MVQESFGLSKAWCYLEHQAFVLDSDFDLASVWVMMFHGRVTRNSFRYVCVRWPHHVKEVQMEIQGGTNSSFERLCCKPVQSSKLAARSGILELSRPSSPGAMAMKSCEDVATNASRNEESSVRTVKHHSSS